MLRNLESDPNNVLAWLNIKPLKANPGKFQFTIFNIGKNKIESPT